MPADAKALTRWLEAEQAVFDRAIWRYEKDSHP